MANISTIKEQVAHNNTGTAIALFKDLWSEKNDLILLEARLHALQKEQINGLINLEEFRIELTKINQSLLDLCDQYKAISEANEPVFSIALGAGRHQIKTDLVANKEILLGLQDAARMGSIDQLVLTDFEFPGLIQFDFAVLSVHKTTSQVADKITFLKMYETAGGFLWENAQKDMDAALSILKKSPVGGFRPPEDGIVDLLNSREDYRLSQHIICFDRQMMLIMGRRDETPKGVLLEMKQFNALNRELELLTYDGLGEKLGLKWG